MDSINNVNNTNSDRRSNEFTPEPKNITSEDKTPECSTSDDVCPTSDDSPSNKWSSERLNKVRRRLFFDEIDDCCDSPTWLEKLSETDKEEKRNKWNFDFEHEIPLEGDWIWERIPAPAAEFPKAQDVVSSMNNPDENRNV